MMIELTQDEIQKIKEVAALHRQLKLLADASHEVLDLFFGNPRTGVKAFNERLVLMEEQIEIVGKNQVDLMAVLNEIKAQNTRKFTFVGVVASAVTLAGVALWKLIMFIK